MVKPLVLDETFTSQMKSVNENLLNISRAIGGEVTKPTTFEEVRILCRSGKIEGLLEIGDVIPFTRDNVVHNAVVMDFIRSGKHSDGLKLRNGLQNGVIFQTEKVLYNLQYDAIEAFYCASSGLLAGTYHFKLGQHSWVPADIGKYFQFTLPVDVPAGGQLVFAQSYTATLDGATIDVYASATSTTTLATAAMSEGQGGTDLGTLNNTVDGNFNSCQRALLGSNRWKTSAMRQHLNSDAAAGSVWTPQTVWDRPPSWASSTKGFLNGCSADLTDYIADVDRSTYLNTACDCTSAEASAGTGKDDTRDKVFLASKKEVWMTSESNSDLTEPFAFYKEGSVSNVPIDTADPIRLKNNQGGTSNIWWLQSPYVGLACSVRVVYGGAGGSNGAYTSDGVAPAFVIA